MMDQHLFMILYFIGVIPLILSVPCKYYLIQQERTWTDAQAYCKAIHMNLAIIKSDENMVRLHNDAQGQFSSTAWIGLYNDINSWHWSLGNEKVGSMTRWNEKEPNNHDGHEECGVLSIGGWWDVTCTFIYPFVCFDDTKTGDQRYVYMSNSMTWHEAQVYCRQYHTDLASTRSTSEYSVIVGLISGWTWIGLFRDSWKWIDQTNFSTISWMSEKPDNALGDENCGYLINNEAVDAQCSDLKPFICYSEITGMKQIIRLEVESNQNVNDPAVMKTLLEQMKQKVKDHGMVENITVKWRKQPDGMVFLKKKGNNTTVGNEEL